MNILRALSAIAVLVVVGWSLLALAMPKPIRLRLPDRLAVSWLVGAGCAAWLVQVSLLVFGRVNPWLLSAAAIVVPLAVARNSRRRPPISLPRMSRSRLTRRDAGVALLLGLLAWQTAYVTAASLPSGLRWDGLAIWAVKAKAIYLDSTVSPGSLLARYTSVSNPAHPMGLPTLEAWVYLWIGAVDEQAIKILGPTFFVAMLALVAGQLMRRLPTVSALLLVCLLASAPWLVTLATTGYADIPLAAYCAGAAAFGADYLQRRRRESEYLATGLAAFMILFKRDGLILCCLFVGSMCVALLMAREFGALRRFILVATLATGIIGGPWLLFARMHGATNPDALPLSLDVFVRNADRIWGTATYMLKLFASRAGSDWGSLGLVWPLVAVVAVARMAHWKRADVAFLGLFCVSYLFVDVSIFVFSNWDPYMNHVKNTLDRLIAQVTPVGILLAGHLLTPGENRSGDQCGDQPAQASAGPAIGVSDGRRSLRHEDRRIGSPAHRRKWRPHREEV